MVKLEIGQRYSTEELKRALDITKDQWKRKKSIYLASLQAAYKYEISYKGHTTYYTIIEQIGEYEKPIRKNAKDKTNQVIKDFIRKTISENPMQTAANINRKAWEDSETNPSEVVLLGLKDSTTGEYIRINMKEMYGTQIGEGGTEGVIEKKVWCKIDYATNTYLEMAPELVDEFYDCFTRLRKVQKKTDIGIFNDYKIGLITRGEMRAALEDSTANLFQEGSALFYNKHGFYPIRVPVYLRREQVEMLRKAGYDI